MKRYRVLWLVCIGILVMACSISIGGSQTSGSGNVITEKRTVSDFTGIDLSCSADVIIEQGRPLAVSIEGEDNILPLIVTKVSGSTLNIDTKPNTGFNTTRQLIVHVTVPELDSIRVTGSGDVTIEKWSAGSVELETTGSGDIHVGDIQADSISARLSGSGDVAVDGGSARSQKLTTSGSGNYNGAEVESREVEARTSGSGDITVWATDSLSAATSGSGDVRYYGLPAVDERSSGSGSVKRLGDNP